jgi:RNA polymerase sigma factor (sigma-70 family)
MDARGTASVSLSAALERCHARGREAHPDLALGIEPFAEHVRACVARRLARQGRVAALDELAWAVAGSTAADLFLAAACVARVPGAWERLQALHDERLQALGRSRGGSPLDAEHAVGALFSDMAVGAKGSSGPPPLAQYDGTGSLFSWLATCLLRRLLARRPRSEAARPIPATAAAGGASGADPAERTEQGELEGRLRRLVSRAVEGLTVQERAALVLTHRDGWSGNDVARVLGVGAPRASRLKAQATGKVRAALLPALRAHGVRGVPGEDVWGTLRDAVAAALRPVAIPPSGLPPSGETPLAPRPPHG